LSLLFSTSHYFVYYLYRKTLISALFLLVIFIIFSIENTLSNKEIEKKNYLKTIKKYLIFIWNEWKISKLLKTHSWQR